MNKDGSLNPAAFHIYDTTLRDGAQQEGLNLSVQDKLNIAKHLDSLGAVSYTHLTLPTKA